MATCDPTVFYRDRRIFITGGTGFFGRSILSMLKRGFLPDTEFVLLSRDPKRFENSVPELAKLPKVRFVVGDVRDFPFPAEHFDFVIHGAAPALTSLPPGEQRSIILDGGRRVLEFAERCGAERVMMISSGAVYGVQPPELEKMPEDFPCRPVTEYGIAKLEAERMFLSSGIPVAIPRCFAFTGPYLNRNIHFAIGNFIRDALAGGPVVVKGDGTPLRSYLYADDLVEWLFALLAAAEENSVCNVGSDRALSIIELAHAVCRALGKTVPVTVSCAPSPGAAPARYVPDIRRAGTLGLRVKVGLEEAIRRSAGVKSRSGEAS